MPRLLVELKSTSKRSFAGHKISATFTQRVPRSADAEIFVPRETSVAIDGPGQVELQFPSTIADDSNIALKILAPDGESLKDVQMPVSQLGSETPLVISAEPKKYFPVEHTSDPAFGKPEKLRGLVVDPAGHAKVGNRQVVISAARDAAGTMEVVAVGKTDGRGYFSLPYPLGPFSAAEGRVSGGGAVPIPLTDQGYFSERIALGVELESEGDATAVDSRDCACDADVPRDPDALDLVNTPQTFSSDVGAGGCIDITKPNRILEEFDFYTIVRTTEPELKGLTLSEPPKVGLTEVVGLLNPSIYRALLSSRTEALTYQPEATSPQEGAVRLATTRPGGVDLSDADALTSRAFITSRPELEHLSEAIGLASLRAMHSEPTEETKQLTVETAGRINLAEVQIEAELAKTLVSDPDGFSLTKLAQAEIITRKNDLLRLIALIKHHAGGRDALSCPNPVDWDDEPTFYQACTIAHGHILHFKQQWVADGYSLGDLLYSLPLAPCQKKQIAVIDWDRRESAARMEALEEQELLTAHLSRDRDISEIANASVREAMSGGSEADTSSFGAGLGIGAIIGPVGGLLGIGGGTSGASSSAWQNSSRTTSANSLQQLRDRTVQGASAIRSQRSTVIQTVRQGETMRVETDVVANHNHCHALTIEYLEVLRHFLVRQQLADVQECLLVPLLMSRFDSAKARRWREVLSGHLRDRRLRRGFDALQRIADNYVGSDMPTGAYAEENLDYLDGYFRIQFRIQRPRDNADGTFLETAWSALSWLGITPLQWWQSYLENQEQRDQVFAEVLGPKIAEEIVNGLQIFAVDENDSETQLPVDPTLISDFTNDTPLYVSLRLRADLSPLRRDRIKFIKIGTTVDTKAGPRDIDTILPDGSKVIVHSGQMGYRTPHLAHDLFRQSRILNDLSGTDGVMIYTPLSRQELRRPREEDKKFANDLLKHLNDHLEHYHRAIWWRMDPQRRYMLLDGFIAPNSGNRSVASVVENRLIGIVGNCLVMPVARGFHLDPTFGQDVGKPIDLLEHYQPNTPVPPARVAVPTKGVFAEAVMGACNSCEKKDDSRFWRWEESPCGDEPTPIEAVGTESRRAEPPSLTPQPFPQPIVAFQNVPAAPDPQGFAGLLELLGNPNLFRDITGLTENQKNALEGLRAAMQTAQFFGGKAADLALQANMRRDIDKALDKINEQHRGGAISDEQRAQLTESALRSMIGGGTTTPAEPMSTEDVERLTNTAGTNDAAVSLTRPGGESVSIDAQPQLAQLRQPLQTACGFFGQNGRITEAELREAVRDAALAEHANWSGAGGARLTESDDSQFGHLVRYWLARFSAIWPSTLQAAQVVAISPTINYGHLLDANPTAAQIAAEAIRVQGDLLAGTPGVGNPPNLHALVNQAIRLARESRTGGVAWSAAFIVAAMRRAAVAQGLEGDAGGTHLGRDELLLAHDAHRVYVREAFNRRFGPGRKDGTYHAFAVGDRAIELGDIICMDRAANSTAGVMSFSQIPALLAGGRALHCDIVVDVSPADHVIAIGGNLEGSVRRRRYPISADHRLVLDATQRIAQEQDNGTLPALPVPQAAGQFHAHNTRRIFAVLTPVEVCAAIPGQQVDGGVLV